MRTKAIVIKKTPMNEYDQMVTCYSEDFGGMRAIARGSLRPASVQSLHVDALNLIEFEVIQGRTYPIVSSAESIAEYPTLKSSLPRLAAVQFFTEVLDRIMFENEKDDDLWDFLIGMLEHFDGIPNNAVLASFRRKQKEFLQVLGYAPRVDRCVVCSEDALSGPEKMVAVSPELGGVLCADCFLAGGRGLLFEKSHVQNLIRPAAELAAARGGALDTFFEYIVGSQLNSLVFLYQSAKI
ncbi:MAG TPA: DNA repair protein RecO [Candidatus Paceibacterota bacterium]|nr:DNA repair protein RecO [Candidatus Paceibacterota bacterium]